jgi:hypothetical protein
MAVLLSVLYRADAEARHLRANRRKLRISSCHERCDTLTRLWVLLLQQLGARLHVSGWLPLRCRLTPPPGQARSWNAGRISSAPAPLLPHGGCRAAAAAGRRWRGQSPPCRRGEPRHWAAASAPRHPRTAPPTPAQSEARVLERADARPSNCHSGSCCVEPLTGRRHRFMVDFLHGLCRAAKGATGWLTDPHLEVAEREAHCGLRKGARWRLDQCAMAAAVGGACCGAAFVRHHDIVVVHIRRRPCGQGRGADGAPQNGRDTSSCGSEGRLESTGEPWSRPPAARAAQLAAAHQAGPYVSEASPQVQTWRCGKDCQDMFRVSRPVTFHINVGVWRGVPDATLLPLQEVRPVFVITRRRLCS